MEKKLLKTEKCSSDTTSVSEWRAAFTVWLSALEGAVGS
jgi:hypothetical protein